MSKTTFKIRIEKRVTSDWTKKEWGRVMSDEKAKAIDREAEEKDGNFFAKDMTDTHGYVEHTSTETRSEDIYVQEVGALDLSKVICAINNIHQRFEDVTVVPDSVVPVA